MGERTFKRSDHDFPTTPRTQRALVAAGRVEGEGPLAPRAAPVAVPKAQRAFTDGDRSLVAKVHGFMPHAQLLAVLNERLRADQGNRHAPYDMARLHAEIASLPDPGGGGPLGWAALRRVLAAARAAGTLARIDERVVADFGVVFSLSAGQAMRLREILFDERGEG